MQEITIRTSALLLSVAIHLLFLSIPLTLNPLKDKELNLVNSIPLTFSPEVESENVGTKSSKGKEKTSSSNIQPFLPKGVNAKNRNFYQKSGTEKNLKGETDPQKLSKWGGKSLNTKVLTKITGKGITKVYALNVQENQRDEKCDETRVKRDKLVPYLISLQKKVIKNWLIPNSIEGEHKASVVLLINKEGKIEEINLVKLSNSTYFNRSAVKAIYASEPFGKLPDGINHIKVKVEFETR